MRVRLKRPRRSLLRDRNGWAGDGGRLRDRAAAVSGNSAASLRFEAIDPDPPSQVDYQLVGGAAVPLRWMAPEAIEAVATTPKPKPITKEANVWSFGVLLWEVRCPWTSPRLLEVESFLSS